MRTQTTRLLISFSGFIDFLRPLREFPSNDDTPSTGMETTEKVSRVFPPSSGGENNFLFGDYYEELFP